MLGLLPLFAGCMRVDSLRMVQDRPEDLEALLKQNEFARIQRLVERHPSLDIAGLQTAVVSHISAYEDDTLADVRTRESEGDLRGAIKRLDDALHKLPDSTRLAVYKDTLETRRTARLQENARHQLLSRARHIAELQQLQQEKLQLESPGISQHWQQNISQQKTRTVSTELLACAHTALQQDDLDGASACLRMADTINASPEVQATWRQLEQRRNSTRRVMDTPAPASPIEQADTGRQRANRQDIRHQLLVETEQALKQNDLLAARKTFHELQLKTDDSGDIDAVKQRLDAAVKASVDGLTRQGDSQYRADKINKAIESWNHALELDPDNTSIQKRLARARKVLARLEELKSRQTTRP